MTDRQKRWKKWYKENRLKVLARVKKYRLEHLDKIKKQQRKSVKKHIKRVRAYSKRYYKTHRKQILKLSKTYIGNPKCLKRRRAWYAKHRKRILKGLKARRKRLGKKYAAYQREWKSRDIKKVRRQARAYSKGYRKTKLCRFLHGKSNAKGVGRLWRIGKKFYFDLLDKPCYYCGASLLEECGSSLDRINNSAGYLESNVLPCCGNCNRIRGLQLTVEEMEYAMGILKKTSKQKCSKIKMPLYNLNKLYPQHEYWMVTKYNRLFCSARYRKLPLKISFDDYSKLVSLPCFYCKKDLGKGLGFCLDRIDNDKGYFLKNIIPCCGSCNNIRSDKMTFKEMVIFMNAVVKYRNQRR